MKYIYEMPVYDGRYKCWRVLNITTGSIYGVEYETQELASHSIEDGKKRAGCIVKRVTLESVRSMLAHNPATRFDNTTPEGPYPLPGDE